MNAPILCIIVPCYNEEKILKETNNQLSSLLNTLITQNTISQNSYICYVDDGSNDTTWKEILLTNQKGIKFSKNFGHQKALMAGYIENTADIYITIDADLQDDISLIEQMVKEYSSGKEIVYGVRNNRDCDNFVKKFTADMYYKLCNVINMNTISQAADFRLVSNKIVNILKKNTISSLYLRGYIANLGFTSSILYYNRKERIGGCPKYTFKKSMELALNGIFLCSDLPLKFIYCTSFVCGTISLLTFFYILYCFILKIKFTIGLILLFSLYFLMTLLFISFSIIIKYLKLNKYSTLYFIEDTNCGNLKM